MGPGRSWRWAEAGEGGEGAVGWGCRPSMMSTVSVGTLLWLLCSAPVAAVLMGCGS